MARKHTYSLLDIEQDASRSTLTADEYKSTLWQGLVCMKENRHHVRSLAKELNVYPKPVNVYAALVNFLLGHIGIEY